MQGLEESGVSQEIAVVETAGPNVATPEGAIDKEEFE